MKKIILTITFITVLTIVANAQNSMAVNKMNVTDSSVIANKLRFSIGFDEGGPVGPVAKQSSFALGGSLQVEYLVLKDLGVTLNVGYLYFMAKNGGKGFSYLPAMGGLNYYFMPRFYLSGQLGTSFNIEADNDEDFSFIYTQGIGVKASKSIDILFKYESVNIAASKNHSFIGGRISYTFGKSK